MPKNKDFALRIEIIDECLRRRQRKWYIEDLLDEVNIKLEERYNKKVSKRTIQYDLNHLIDERQAPIERCRDGQRVYYKYTESNYSVMNLPISEEEVEILKDAVDVLRQVNDFKIVGEVDAIIEKLNHTISTNVAENRLMIQFEKHSHANGIQHIDNIFTAIKEKIPLKISYQPFGADDCLEWLIHPYLLKEYRNRWFLIGRRDDFNKVSNLALDRIKKIKNSSAPFVENDLFNPETLYAYLIGVTFPDGEQPQDVVIKVKGRQGYYVRTKPIHETQEIVNQPDEETLIIKLRLINNYELRSVLLSYGADFEVLQPESLRSQLAEIHKRALNDKELCK